MSESNGSGVQVSRVDKYVYSQSMGFHFLRLTSGCRLKNIRGQPGLGGLAVCWFKDAEVRCFDNKVGKRP